MQTEYVLDGERFNTLDEFYAEVGRVFVGGKPWGENLNALNNLLRGNFGSIPGEFRLVWRHQERSRFPIGLC